VFEAWDKIESVPGGAAGKGCVLAQGDQRRFGKVQSMA
jgi:hypothetical protein